MTYTSEEQFYSFDIEEFGGIDWKMNVYLTPITLDVLLWYLR